MPGERLIVLETEAQAQWLARRPSGRLEGEALLAITPEAAYACQMLGWPYLKVEDHAQSISRLAAYPSLMTRYEAWEGWLDQQGQQLMPEFGRAGFRAAHAATFLVQTLLAELWAAGQSARELLETLRPAAVATWPPEIRGVPWYLHPTVAALPALLPPIAVSHHILVENLALQAPELAPVSMADVVSRGLKPIARWLRHQVRQWLSVPEWSAVSGGWRGLFRQWQPGVPRVLISGHDYDVGPLAAVLRRQGVRVQQFADVLPPPRWFSSRPHLPAAFYSELAAAEMNLLEMPELDAPLTWCGLADTPLWRKPLEFWWRHLVPELWHQYWRVERTLARRRFSAVVIWENGGNALCSAAANAAATTHCPCYAYQHGGAIGVSHPTWQAMYLKPDQTCLAYGPGTVQEIRQNSLPPYQHSRVIAVGSARFDMLRKHAQPGKSRQLRAQLQDSDQRPLILYIPTHFAGYGRAIGDLATYPDVSYFELQQQILMLWLQAPAVRLIYKDFVVAQSRGRVMADFIQRNIPNALVTTQRLTDLMWAVDAIVVDHTLTALAEVLLTSKPVVVYAPQPSTTLPQAKRLLEKRATIAETPEAFVAAVRWLLQAGTYRDLPNPNTEFLQAHGTHLNDGRSAERAADVILGRVRS